MNERFQNSSSLNLKLIFNHKILPTMNLDLFFFIKYNNQEVFDK